MQNIRNITDKILWVGASDRRLHLFENMFPVPDGVALQFLCDPGREDSDHGHC